MTTVEGPLANLLELHTSADGSAWVPWFGNANQISVSRGGRVNGASTSVDVGNCSIQLINAGDPLTDSTLQPNQMVRLRTKAVGDVTVPVYTQGFETGLDGWTAGGATGASVTRSGSTAHTGTSAAMIGRTATSGAITLSKSLTALLPGTSYTLGAWWFGNFPAASLSVGITGLSNTTTGTQQFGVWVYVSYTFTATATSHTAVLTVDPYSSWAQSNMYNWDDVTLSGPNPLYRAPSRVFTGRILDLATSYKLDKSTNTLTTFVTISAVDAVNSHQNVQRNGAVTPGGVGFETWAARINRLATSSVEPINPPADDSPIVRYAI